MDDSKINAPKPVIFKNGNVIITVNDNDTVRSKRGERMKKIYLEINQKPVSVNYECPECGEEIEIDYIDFTNLLGEPCEWDSTIIFCKNCNKKSLIDGWEFL